MTIRKFQTSDKTAFTTFIESTIVNPIPFPTETVAKAIINDTANRNYLAVDDVGNIIGGGSWNTQGPTLRWIIMKETTFSLDKYMGLVYKMVSDCLDEGFTTGFIPVSQKWMINLLPSYFQEGLEITEKGWNPTTYEAVEWMIKVDLQKVVNKLKTLTQI